MFYQLEDIINLLNDCIGKENSINEIFEDNFEIILEYFEYMGINKAFLNKPAIMERIKNIIIKEFVYNLNTKFTKKGIITIEIVQMENEYNTIAKGILVGNLNNVVYRASSNGEVLNQIDFEFIDEEFIYTNSVFHTYKDSSILTSKIEVKIDEFGFDKESMIKTYDIYGKINNLTREFREINELFIDNYNLDNDNIITNVDCGGYSLLNDSEENKGSKIGRSLGSFVCVDSFPDVESDFDLNDKANLKSNFTYITKKYPETLVWYKNRFSNILCELGIEFEKQDINKVLDFSAFNCPLEFFRDISRLPKEDALNIFEKNYNYILECGIQSALAKKISELGDSIEILNWIDNLDNDKTALLLEYGKYVEYNSFDKYIDLLKKYNIDENKLIEIFMEYNGTIKDFCLLYLKYEKKLIDSSKFNSISIDKLLLKKLESEDALQVLEKMEYSFNDKTALKRILFNLITNGISSDVINEFFIRNYSKYSEEEILNVIYKKNFINNELTAQLLVKYWNKFLPEFDKIILTDKTVQSKKVKIFFEIEDRKIRANIMESLVKNSSDDYIDIILENPGLEYEEFIKITEYLNWNKDIILDKIIDINSDTVKIGYVKNNHWLDKDDIDKIIANTSSSLSKIQIITFCSLDIVSKLSLVSDIVDDENKEEVKKIKITFLKESYSELITNFSDNEYMHVVTEYIERLDLDNEMKEELLVKFALGK